MSAEKENTPASETRGVLWREMEIKSMIPQNGQADKLEVIALDLSMEHDARMFDDALFVAGYEVRYNILANRTEWRVPLTISDKVEAAGEWQPWTDTSAAMARHAMAEIRHGLALRNKRGPIDDIVGLFRLNAGQMEDAVSLLAAQNPVHPLIEWLENDVPRWDSVRRLEYLMEDTFTLKDTPGTEEGAEDENWTLAQWGSVYILLGTIQRSYEPGIKLDEMLVIIGKPGIGKSTLLRHLLPPHLQSLFSDGLALDSDPKERVEALQGKAIVEIGEMAGARQADRESLKTFLSRTDDGNVRLAYRRNPEPMRRRANLIGTADRPDPLPDDDNVRRFVPVTLVDGDASELRTFIDEHREMLWAEALELYQRGQSARLPESFKGIQAKAAAAARAVDTVMEDKVMVFLESKPQGFTMEEMALACGVLRDASATLSVTEAKRLGQVLRRNQYESKRKWDKGSRGPTRWYIVGSFI